MSDRLVSATPLNQSRRERPAVSTAMSGRAINGIVRGSPYGFGLLLSAVLVVPFELRQNSWVEWGNAYWLLHEQQAHIRQTGLPTYFLSSGPSGVDYPIFVFYGGFALTALAFLAVITSTWFAFIFSIFAAFMMGYVGMYWSGRAIGLNRLGASLLSIVAVCTPYFVTNLYGRGAWAELVGVGASYLVLGAVLRTLRELQRDRARRTTLISLAAGVSLLAGAHNISLLLGVVFIGVAVAALTPFCIRSWHASMRSRAAWRIVIPGLVGIGLCAAWLVPNVWLADDTAIASLSTVDRTAAFDTASIVLWPSLRFPDARRALNTDVLGPSIDVRVFNQTCSLLLIVIIVGLLGMRKGAGDDPSSDRRLIRRRFALAVLLAAAAGTFVLMIRPTWWGSFPSVLRMAQFPMRLNPYLSGFLVLLTAVVVSIVHLRRTSAVVMVLLAVTAAWYAGLAVHQSTTARPLAGPALHIASHESIDAGELPPAFGSGFYQTVQFRLTSLGLAVQRPAQDLAFDQEGHLTSGAVVEVGSYATNVVWSPLIRAESATIIGHDEDGFAVVRLDAVDVATKSASIRANYPRRVLAGIVVTLVSLSAVVVAVAWEILKVRRRLLVARRAVASAQ